MFFISFKKTSLRESGKTNKVGIFGLKLLFIRESSEVFISPSQEEPPAPTHPQPEVEAGAGAGGGEARFCVDASYLRGSADRTGA